MARSATKRGSTGGCISPTASDHKAHKGLWQTACCGCRYNCKEKQTVLTIGGWQQSKDLPAEDVDVVVHASSGYHAGVCGVYVNGQDAPL